MAITSLFSLHGARPRHCAAAHCDCVLARQRDSMVARAVLQRCMAAPHEAPWSAAASVALLLIGAACALAAPPQLVRATLEHRNINAVVYDAARNTTTVRLQGAIVRAVFSQVRPLSVRRSSAKH